MKNSFSVFTSLQTAIDSNSFSDFSDFFKKNKELATYHLATLNNSLIKNNNIKFLKFLQQQGLAINHDLFIDVLVNKNNPQFYTEFINNEYNAKLFFTGLCKYYLKIGHHDDQKYNFGYVLPYPKPQYSQFLLKHLQKLNIDFTFDHPNQINFLHISATYASPKALKFLLPMNLFSVNSLDDKNFTPLHYALQNNSENAKILLSSGARLDLLNKYQESPIFSMIRFGIINNPVFLNELINQHPNKSELIKEYYRFINNNGPYNFYLSKDLDQLIKPLLIIEKNQFLSEKISQITVSSLQSRITKKI